MAKYIVRLTVEERESLLSLLRVGKSLASKMMRARVLLAADRNYEPNSHLTDSDIAQREYISIKTIARIRQRFVEEGCIEALSRKPHGNPKSHKLDGEQEAQLIALCCSKPPEGHCRWTLRLLSNKIVAMEITETISRSTICRILKKRKLSLG